MCGLRQYFPKGTDLRVDDADQIAAVADELNARPRKTLDGDTRPNASPMLARRHRHLADVMHESRPKEW